MKTKLLGLIFSVCASVAALAQTDNNGHLWLNYIGSHPIKGGPWGLHLETQVRRADMGDNWQQLLLRGGLTYAVTPQLSLAAGYAYVRTYPYGDYPALDEFPEHRAWQQASYTHPAWKLELQHRVRLEQRFIGVLSPDGGGGYEVNDFRYENRFRYMLRATLPLTEDKKNYLVAWNEVFFNFGSEVVGNHFDQNRAFLGYGRKLSDTTRLEIGFLEQTLQKRGGQIWENNHTIAIWLHTKFPFGKK